MTLYRLYCPSRIICEHNSIAKIVAIYDLAKIETQITNRQQCFAQPHVWRSGFLRSASQLSACNNICINLEIKPEDSGISLIFKHIPTRFVETKSTVGLFSSGAWRRALRVNNFGWTLLYVLLFFCVTIDSWLDSCNVWGCRAYTGWNYVSLWE